jgi:two-component system OmpR family response regulator
LRLLLLEDDTILGEGLRDYLLAQGHVVDWCQRVSEAMALGGEAFDVLLVDWQLPDGSGLDWVRTLRRRGLTTPVLLLTARDLLSDRIQGLDAGADDYLVKPFAPPELAARIRAVSRRAHGLVSPRLALAGSDASLDMQAKRAFLHDIPVDLTAREWSILEALALRAGRLVSKSDLEGLVLGLDADLNSNALEVHISSIRRKLGKGVIETVRGMGYRVPA